MKLSPIIAAIKAYLAAYSLSEKKYLTEEGFHPQLELDYKSVAKHKFGVSNPELPTCVEQVPAGLLEDEVFAETLHLAQLDLGEDPEDDDTDEDDTDEDEIGSGESTNTENDLVLNDSQPKVLDATLKKEEGEATTVTDPENTNPQVSSETTPNLGTQVPSEPEQQKETVEPSQGDGTPNTTEVE